MYPRPAMMNSFSIETGVQSGPATRGTDVEKQVTTESMLSNIYFDGFDIALSSAGVRITLKLNNQPIQVLHCSYILANTLARKLTRTFEVMAEVTGRPECDCEEMDDFLKIALRVAQQSKTERFPGGENGSPSPGPLSPCRM